MVRLLGREPMHGPKCCAARSRSASSTMLSSSRTECRRRFPPLRASHTKNTVRHRICTSSLGWSVRSEPEGGSAAVTASNTEGRKFRDYSEPTIRGLASNTGDVDPSSFSSSNDHVGAIVDVVVSETVVSGRTHPAVVATHVVAPASATIVPFNEVAVIG